MLWTRTWKRFWIHLRFLFVVAALLSSSLLSLFLVDNFKENSIPLKILQYIFSDFISTPNSSLTSVLEGEKAKKTTLNKTNVFKSPKTSSSDSLNIIMLHMMACNSVQRFQSVKKFHPCNFPTFFSSGSCKTCFINNVCIGGIIIFMTNNGCSWETELFVVLTLLFYKTADEFENFEEYFSLFLSCFFCL